METAPKSMPSPLRISDTWAALDGLDRASMSWERAMSPPSDPLATNARFGRRLQEINEKKKDLMSGEDGPFEAEQVTAEDHPRLFRHRKVSEAAYRWLWKENPRDLTAGLRLGQSIKTMESRATAAMARRTAVYGGGCSRQMVQSFSKDTFGR
ncbi:ATP-dependent RNA helicase HAS1 [Striga asiatica]|uniref:ATP-dependent RNA helicase HAS1 n=1 Tax=Striga asiatica TaxID=4170 RepID=A0A5A7NWX9_STRAF|nr:ATP-dependent RNA helicase HAS1 [Striga asiatica]